MHLAQTQTQTRKPRPHARHALTLVVPHDYSGIPSSAPLTSLERMDTVLTFDALEMEDEWNADYEKVEASVKVQVADLIFEELLFDTAFAVTDAKSH